MTIKIHLRGLRNLYWVGLGVVDIFVISIGVNLPVTICEKEY